MYTLLHILWVQIWREYTCMKHLITQAINNQSYIDILLRTITLTHLEKCTRNGRKGLLSWLQLKVLESKGRKEGTVLRSVHTHKFFCYTKEVHHLSDAKEGSDHNHTASRTSEEHCWPLVFEKGTANKIISM
jgi:hypothetical protein